MNRILKILLYLGLVIALVLIADMNADQRVDITWFPGRALEDVPVFVVVLGSIFIGVAVAGVLGTVEHFRHQLRERELSRKIDELEAELRELRNLPISEGLLADADEEPSDWEPPE